MFTLSDAVARSAVRAELTTSFEVYHEHVTKGCRRYRRVARHRRGTGQGFSRTRLPGCCNGTQIKPSDDPNILTVAGDIGDPRTARRVIREGVARFGRIDTLVNNAGIFIAKPFTHTPRKTTRR